MRKIKFSFLNRILRRKHNVQRGKKKGKDTKKKYSIDYKTYTKDRHVLHQKIIRMIEKPNAYPKNGSKPIAILIDGGTASGKTTMRKTIIEKELHSKSIHVTVIDLDEIKEYIPEYTIYKKTNPQQAASFVHKESYDISVLLLNKLIREQKNFIYEGTMARRRRYQSLVHQLKKQQYEIHAYVVDVPLSVAIKRADERAQITGRKVPPSIIKNTHKLVPRTFADIKNLLDSYHVYDNQHGFKLIASNDFVDAKRYANFVLKGKTKKLRQ
ncbi:zeta toxin family protein [Oceanobacillus longus]|uniref:UDP-N-acetylglucosamine kinase n=1 Tax=Oceanobacillus longus TaxID=930120 RepID=A0ABV8H3S1_9BACI